MKPLPSDAELQSLVADAVARAAPLDPILMHALFNGNAPQLDSDWPPEQRRAYYRSVELWRRMRRASPSPSRFSRWPDPPTVAQAWSIIEAVAPDRTQWWRVPHLTWALVARELGMPERVAAYHLCDVQGWTFKGLHSTRTVVRAPCISCEKPTAAAKMIWRFCGACGRLG